MACRHSWQEAHGEAANRQKYSGMRMQYRASEGWSVTMTYNSNRSRITKSMPLEEDGTPQTCSVKVKETFFKPHSHKSRSQRAVRGRKPADHQASAPDATRTATEGDSDAKRRAAAADSDRSKDGDSQAVAVATGIGAGIVQRTHRQLEIRDAISGERLPTPQHQAFQRRLLSGAVYGSGSAAELLDPNTEREPIPTPRLYWPFSSLDTRRGHTRVIPLAPWRRRVFGDVHLSAIAANMRQSAHRSSTDSSGHDDTTDQIRRSFNGVYTAQMSTFKDGFPVRYSPKPPSRGKASGPTGELAEVADATQSAWIWQRRR